MIQSVLSPSMRLLFAVLRLTGRLPLPLLHRMGSLLGGVMWLANGRARKVAERNLQMVEAASGIAPTPRRVRRVLAETGKSIIEIARVWTGNPDAALAMIRSETGMALFDAALADRRGVIVVAPHLGCWELLNYWLASRTPISIVYRPPKRATLEPFLLRARGLRNVEQVRAEGAGVRTLYKRLQGGGVVGILPDQQPKQGEGEFAPFFGVEALTMVLVSRLAQRTGAQVLFAFVERLGAGAGYVLRFHPAPDGIADTDLRVACKALNAGVERCVRDAFDQYQWPYKRYSLRPSPLEANPYR